MAGVEKQQEKVITRVQERRERQREGSREVGVAT